jgi:hypothetical protein
VLLQPGALRIKVGNEAIAAMGVGGPPGGFTICGDFIYSRGRSSLSAPAQIRPSGLPAYGSASRARRRGALGGRVETDN